MESLPYIGSTASVLLMKNQIVKNAVNQETALNWMWSIAFMIRYVRIEKQKITKFKDKNKFFTDQIMKLLDQCMI